MMKIMPIAIHLVASVLLCSSLVFADEDTARLGVITVTSPGTEQRIEDVQASVEVIDEEKIRSFSGRSLSQVFHYATGFFVRDSGSNSRITLRGFDDDHALILVNGLRRTVKYGNTSADLNGLQLEDIERIEIVRGPMSALYGSEALAGVINVVTKKATDEKSFRATIIGGIAEREQRDTVIFKGAANLGKYGSTTHRVSFEVKKRDEFREDRDDPFTTLNEENKLFLSYGGTYDINPYHWLGWNFEYYNEEDDGISSAGNVPTFENEERYHLDGKYHNETGFGILDVAFGYGRNNAESDRTAGTESTDYDQIGNRSHSLATDRLLQGFNRGQGCTKRRILNGLCFETRKRLLAVRGESE